MGKAEEHIELRSPSYPSSSAPSSSIIKNPSYTVPKTILSPQPIRDNPQYTKAVRQERALIILILLIIVILGPLVFRYCLGCQTDSSDESSPTWGQNLDPFEIYILLAVFSNMTGSIIRILPAVCGGPATIESVKTIQLEGQVSLCIVTPFCAEGDEMLLRNLLGRTCTLFHTVSSRHTLQGLYVDVTMNERRLKGEANRKKLFYEWMGFLTTLIKICQKKEKLKLLSTEKVLSSEKDTTLTSSLPNEQLPSSEPGKPIVYANKYSENITNFQSRFHSFRKYGENVFDMGRDASTFDFAPSVVIDNRNSIQLRNTRRQSTVATTASPSLIHENPLPIVENTISPSPLPRESPQTHTNNHLNHLQMYPNGLSDRLAGDRDITNAAVLNGLVVNLESIEPVINFFDQWLAEMKLNERIYHYGDKK